VAVGDERRGDRSTTLSGTTYDVGILDTAGLLVNPATEEKQDDGNASLASIDGSIESVQRGNDTLLKTTNLTVECLLKEAVLQLKINNAYNAVLVNEVITEMDIT
jgi:hypothetical protein